MLNGAIAGLVSIAPAAGFVDTTGSFFIGLVSGPVCYYGISLKKLLGFDDALDAFGLHGIAGVYGGLMTGLFADVYGSTGAFYGNPAQIGLQLYGIVVCSGWSLFMTGLLLVLVDVTIGLRVSVDAEKSGLDRSTHGQGLYAERSKTITPSERVAELLRSYAIAKEKSNEEAVANLRESVPDLGRVYREGPVSDDSSLTNSEVGNDIPCPMDGGMLEHKREHDSFVCTPKDNEKSVLNLKNDADKKPDKDNKIPTDSKDLQGNDHLSSLRKSRAVSFSKKQ